MGFFNDFIDGFVDVGTSFFTGGSLGGGIANAVIDTGTSFIGNEISDFVFGNPAEEAAEANRQAARERAAALEAQAQAIRDGNAQAAEYYQKIIDMSGPAFDNLRKTSASDPGNFNPVQKRRMADAVTRSQNALPFTMKGSGRAQTDAILRLQEGTSDSIYNENLKNKKDATNLLAGKGFTAMNDTARLASEDGTATGNAAAKGGAAGANATEASGFLMAQESARRADPLRNSLENLGSFIRDDTKKNAANDRYKKAAARTIR
jgi:hypothetical protein